MEKELLIQNIREWLQIDNELKELRRAAKERRERKKELTNDLVDIMKNNEIDCFDVNGGKLIYSRSKTKAPLSKKHLLTALAVYFKHDPQQVGEISNHILNTREDKIKETIRRKIQK